MVDTNKKEENSNCHCNKTSNLVPQENEINVLIEGSSIDNDEVEDSFSLNIFLKIGLVIVPIAVSMVCLGEYFSKSDTIDFSS